MQFMKILKILLLLTTAVVAIIFTIGVFINIKEERWYYMPLYHTIIISLSFLLSVSCTAYHIASFKFYRKKISDTTLSKFFLIGAIACSVFAIYVAVQEYIRLYLGAGIATDVLVVMFLIFVYGVLNLVEVIYLRKQIKQLKKTSLETEIDTIGDSH